MQFNILTLFPEACSGYLATSIIGRAQKNNHIKVDLLNIRDFTTDKHHITDDTPYGGGAGMVMKIEPIHNALLELQKTTRREDQHIIVLSARGQQFTQGKAQELATSKKNIVLICGRYEGIDQRVADNLADEEISIGPYVLAGGELAAMIITEAVARLVPGVLGNPDSLTQESFNTLEDSKSEDYQEYPQYTKPENYKDWSVPPVLLSGNHKEIEEWRKKSAQ